MVRWVTRRTARRAACAIALVLVLAACGILGGGAAGSLDRQRQQAQDALDRWASAAGAAGAANGSQPGFSLVGDPTQQVGSWELAVGDNDKRALYAGAIEAATPLPDAPQPAAEVRWEDGTTASFPVMTAAEAVEAIRTFGGQDCLDCTPLRVTGATLTSVRVETTTGPATAPAWELTLEGTAVRLTRVAVVPTVGVTVSPPPWDSNNPPAGLSIESALVSPDGRQLTVTFVGAPKPGSQLGGVDYTAEAVESSLAVVVIVVEHPNPLSGAGSAVGAERTATVQLRDPLGGRAVLEVKEGLPVPVS